MIKQFKLCINIFNVGMHSDCLGLICFKLGLMIDIVLIYILMLVYLTLTLIQGHRDMRKQKLLYRFFHKVSHEDLDGIWYCVETC